MGHSCTLLLHCTICIHPSNANHRPREVTRPGISATSTLSSSKIDHETKANAGQGKGRLAQSCLTCLPWTFASSRQNPLRPHVDMYYNIAWSCARSTRPLIAHDLYTVDVQLWGIQVQSPDMPCDLHHSSSQQHKTICRSSHVRAMSMCYAASASLADSPTAEYFV